MSSRPLVADHVAQLRPYTPGKPVEALKRELGLSEVVKLASNENALGPPEAARHAIEDALDALWVYPDGAAHEFAHAVAAYTGAQPAQVVPANGSDEIIALVLQTFCRPGDVVVSAEHAFLQYELFAAARGMQVVKAPARERFHYDLDAMADVTRARGARLVCVANPSNPTGSWIGRRALAQFLEAIGPDPIVIIDEAYFEYVDASEYASALICIPDRPRTVIMRTFSKAWGLAALRVGYGITSVELADYLHRVRTPFNVNRLAQRAAVAALSQPGHLEAVRAFNQQSKAQLLEGLVALGLGPGVVPSQTNFYLVDVGVSGHAVYEALLRRGVIVRPMDAYELPTCIRITAARATENARLLEALPEALAEVRASQ